MPAATDLKLTFSPSPYPVDFFEHIIRTEAQRRGIEIEINESERPLQKRGIDVEMVQQTVALVAVTVEAGRALAPLIEAVRERLRKKRVEVDTHYGHEDGYR